MTIRTVVTEGIVVRMYASSLSSKATARYKAHTVECRYSDTGVPMQQLVDRIGHDRTRTKIAIGIVEPCSYCKPVLIEEKP